MKKGVSFLSVVALSIFIFAAVVMADQSETVMVAEKEVCKCDSNRYNCSDFKTHAAAQACYEYCLKKSQI